MKLIERMARGAPLVCALATAVQTLSLWMPAHKETVYVDGRQRLEVHTAISHTEPAMGVMLGAVALASFAIHLARLRDRRGLAAAWFTFAALVLIDLVLLRDLAMSHFFAAPKTMIGDVVGPWTSLLGLFAGLCMAFAGHAMAPAPPSSIPPARVHSGAKR
jgi:hypothetical protein